jgi:hypothetical protein
MKIESRDAVFALAFEGAASPVTSQVLSVAWTPEVLAVLHQIRKEATERERQQDEDAYLNLPYADLRARMVLLEGRWGSMRDDVGLRSISDKVEDPKPWGFLTDVSDARNSLKSLGDAFAQWSQGQLRNYSESRGAYELGLARLQEFGKQGKLIKSKPARVQLFPWPEGSKGSGGPFDVSAGFLASRLEGKELFPGLGPVVRIVGGADHNSAELMSRPSIAANGRFSLVCEITLETLPGAQRPIVFFHFKRRRWADKFHDRPVSSSIGGFVFPHATRPHSAFRFTLSRHKSGWVTDLGYLHFQHELGLALGYTDERVLDYPCDAHASVLVMVKADVAEQGDSELNAGVPLVDQADAFANICQILQPLGLVPFRDYQIADAPNVAAPPLSLLKAEVTLTRLLERQEDEEEGAGSRPLEERIEAATGSPASRFYRAKKGPELEAAHAQIVGAIRTLVSQTGYAKEPQRSKIYFLTSTPEDVEWVKTTAHAILGDAIQLVSGTLPAGTHGLQSTLPEPDKRRRDRFKARVRAWEAFAASQKLPARSMILVQAPWNYRDENGKLRREDYVNKAAAKKALASLGHTVQYLLPSAEGWVDKFLPRAQAAILDLVFGHGGLVWGLNQAAEAHFEHADKRPRLIAGIGSLVVQTDWRRSASVLVATRIEVETGRAWVRFGHQEAEFVVSDWMPFDQGAQYLASRRIELPRKVDAKRSAFAGFLVKTFDNIRDKDPNAVVFIQSKRATHFGHWLADSGIDGTPIEVTPNEQAMKRWPGLRLLRIRSQAPAMGQEKIHHDKVFDGQGVRTWTTTQRLFQVGGATAPTFWSLAKPTTHHKRGASCYREIRLPNPKRTEERPDSTCMYPARPEDQHTSPRAIEIVVLQRQEDDTNTQLAAFAQALRAGMLTAGNQRWVSAPSPVQIIRSFEQYLRV